MLLQEARKLLKINDLGEIEATPKKRGIVLTEDHIMEWLQIFEADRIMLDGCNHATVKR
jgi:hypothetical protein